jgi:complex iron-sulfur molybdoenzyme family reductase subunit gamma
MRARRHATLALLLAASPAARAAEDPLAADTVEVAPVPGPLSADPGAAYWGAAPPREVAVLPQRTVRLHDRKANEALAAAGPRTVSVRAVADGRDVAVLLEWADPTEDRAGRAPGQPDEAAPGRAGGSGGASRSRPSQHDSETDAYADAAALQLPLQFGAGKRLPYVGMGDDEMKVAVHLQRAAAAGTVAREAVASGFGSLTRADLGGAKVAMRHDPARGVWRAVFVRPLAAAGVDLRRGLVPFAVAVWDGARAERGGNKALSGWKLLRLRGFPVEAAYTAELSRGRGPDERGDPARGERLVLSMCTGCHAVGERRSARPGIAPDLTGIGAVATPAYLRQSIVEPSAVVVPGPSPGQHQDRARAPGVTGAFPASDAFTWHRPGPGGKKVSKMPAYAGMAEPDLRAMVAYLATLGAAEVEGGKKP